MNDHSTKVSVTVYFTDYGLKRLADRNITQEEVINTIESASGRYRGFSYVHNGADRVGFWHEQMLVSTEFDGQGDLQFINAFRNVARRTVDAIIKRGRTP